MEAVQFYVRRETPPYLHQVPEPSLDDLTPRFSVIMFFEPCVYKAFYLCWFVSLCVTKLSVCQSMCDKTEGAKIM